MNTLELANALELSDKHPELINVNNRAAAELRRLHSVNAELLESLQEVVKLANQAHDHWDNDRDAKVGKILLALSGHMPRYDKRIDTLHAAIAKATGVAA